MKLKKLLFALCISVLSLCATFSVSAQSYSFKADGQKTLSGVTVKTFKVGDQSIDVNLEPHGYVYAYVKHSDGTVDKIKANPREVTVPCATTVNGCTPRTWKESGHRAGSNGNYTVKLNKPLAIGDVVTLSFSDSGNFHFGQLTFIDEKAYNDRLQKQREAEEKKAHDMYLEYMKYEESKTWQQRLKDKIKDAWWNFKSWWRG